MTEPCKHCIKTVPDGFYDFERDCCATRFVVDGHSKEQCTARLAYVEKTIGVERTDHIKQLVAEAWAKHKGAAQ